MGFAAFASVVAPLARKGARGAEAIGAEGKRGSTVPVAASVPPAGTSPFRIPSSFPKIEPRPRSPSGLRV